MCKDPLKTDVNAGLAKIYEASEQITEKEIEELAEKARKEAAITKQTHLDKLEQQGIEPKD